MSRVWTPAENPPKLDTFCHLSHDAQVVMAALYRDYHQRRNAILSSQRKIDPRSYYQTLYAARFGGDTDKSQPQVQNSQRSSSCLSLEQMTERSTVSDYSDSPPIETQDYRRLSQYQTDLSPSLDSTATDGGLDQASQSLFSQDPILPVQLGSAENSILSKDKDSSHCITNVSESEELECGQSSHIFDRSENQPLESPIFSAEHLASAGIKGYHAEAMETEQTRQSEDSGSNTDPISAIDTSTRSHRGDDSGANIGLEISEAAPADDIVLRPELDIVLRPELDIVLRPELDIVLRPELQCTVTDEVEDPLSSTSKPVSASKQQVAVQPIDKGSCGKTDLPVFDIFKKPLKPVQLQCRPDSVKRTSSSSRAFATPFKKTKTGIEGCLGKEASGSAAASTGGVVVDLSTAPSTTWSNVFDSILHSKEVLLTALYTDGSSQLRDSLFGQDTKKRSASRWKLSSAVNSVAVLCQRQVAMDTTIYLVPVRNAVEELLSSAKKFWRSLLDSDVRKICYHAKFLFNTLFKSFDFSWNTVNLDWTVLDPSIAHWLLDPDNPVSGFDQILTVANLPPLNPDMTGTDALRDDLVLMGVVMERLFQRLQSRALWELFMCVETKLIPLLTGMELREIHVATETLFTFSDILKRKLAKLEQKAYKEVGHSFLISSHSQLRQVLFEELRLDSKLPGTARLAKTNVGHQTSTSETVLTQLAPYHPLPGLVLEYRQLQKLKSTYIDGILSCVEDGKLVSHWDQTAAATGRLTSCQPNIQAIPKVPVTIAGYKDNFIAGKEEDDTVEIFARDAFRSRDGWSFLAADFQQIELRLLAHLTNDPVLLNVFTDPAIPDIFNELTAQWLGKSLADISGSEREQTKRVVYSVLYGVGKEKLAEYLKISPEHAKSIMTSFLLKFPAVGQFTKSCIEFCQRNGFTCSIFKRRRMFPNIKHRSPPLRAQAERQAVNFCVQGSAADICKAAMLQVEHALYTHPDIQARLLVQIHDELLLEVANNDLGTVSALVKGVMESQEKLCGSMLQLKVPIKVSLSTGKTWGHMSPL